MWSRCGCVATTSAIVPATGFVGVPGSAGSSPAASSVRISRGIFVGLELSTTIARRHGRPGRRRLLGQQEQLGVAVADVAEEVDEVVGADLVDERLAGRKRCEEVGGDGDGLCHDCLRSPGGRPSRPRPSAASAAPPRAGAPSLPSGWNEVRRRRSRRSAPGRAPRRSRRRCVPTWRGRRVTRPRTENASLMRTSRSTPSGRFARRFTTALSASSVTVTERRRPRKSSRPRSSSCGQAATTRTITPSSRSSTTT